MSDTTAYLAGCATTGVAALVLLVARMGMVGTDASSANHLGDRLARIEATSPNLQANTQANTQANQQMEFELRSELAKQRELTQKLEDQLNKQSSLSSSLEAQIKAQETKNQDLLTKVQTYQRSVEDLELQDKIAAASEPSTRNAGPSASVIWLGAGVVIVLILGGGGLILCAIILILQSQRRSNRPAPMPPPIPMPPAAPYRYYDQSFLPPAQLRSQRPSYYDYPHSPYDYTP